MEEEEGHGAGKHRLLVNPRYSNARHPRHCPLHSEHAGYEIVGRLPARSPVQLKGFPGFDSQQRFTINLKPNHVCNTPEKLLFNNRFFYASFSNTIKKDGCCGTSTYLF